MAEDGSLTLSPFYDLLPTKVILPSDHEDLGMLFDGVKENLRKHNFDSFCKTIGLTEMAKNKIMASIDKKESAMVEIIASSSLHQNAKTRWIRMIHSNILRAKKP